MKKLFLLAAFIYFCLISCTNKKGVPDVSGVKVNISLERFDQDFFTIDSNNVLPGLNNVHEKYPLFTSLFLQNILGLDSASTLIGVKRFLHLSEPIHDSANAIFRNTDWLEKDLTKAFQFIKYYFPNYKLPAHIVTIIGPIDALAKMGNEYSPDFIGPDFLGVSLQFYLGKNFSIYKDPTFIENVAPGYRSRRFSKEYIVADAMKLVVDDIFPDRSAGRSLIGQMIEKGKQWWLLDKFLPGVPDSLKTGYTRDQLDWCKANEGIVWSFLTTNEDINSINPTTIQTYIGEAPFTQTLSQEASPGNIGQWIGWQIVKKFADKNSTMKPEEVMQTDPEKILEEAKYKPK